MKSDKFYLVPWFPSCTWEPPVAPKLSLGQIFVPKLSLGTSKKQVRAILDYLGGIYMDAWKNQLFFGDNLEILRSGRIPLGSVDLIYLDPPFNPNATFKELGNDH